MKKINFYKIKRPYVFVPMCLDFLHHGHINIIKKANNYGNVILGLLTDRGIISYKKKRPIIEFKNRKKIAMMLKNVTYIKPIKNLDSCISLSKKYKFEYVVHGDDWKKSKQQSEFRIKLKESMKNWRGKVIDVPYTKKIFHYLIKFLILFSQIKYFDY